MVFGRGMRLASVAGLLAVVFSVAAVDYAEARARGSFGSRGTRTFQTAPTTQTAPNTVAPVQRSMTPAQQSSQAARQPAQAQRMAPTSGFGGALMRGLLFGGILGLLMGTGFGGLGGMLSLLAQVVLIGGVIWLAMRFLRPRQAATAGGPPLNATPYQAGPNPGRGHSGLGSMMGGLGSQQTKPAAKANPDELGITGKDLDAFEGLLTEMQQSYGREDYAALRAITTPEMMGYLAEELAQNASNGVKNEISEVKLLQGDLSESWREGTTEYATVAMRYELIDVTRDRETGAVVEGDPDAKVEATQLWTFVRERNGRWLISAMQDA